MNKIECKQAFDKYIDFKNATQRSPHTVKTYAATFSIFYRFLKDDEEIKYLTLLNWRDQLNRDGIKPNSINCYITIMVNFFKWCKRLGYSSENINISREDLPKKEEIKYDLLKLEEIKLLLSVTPSDIPKMYPTDKKSLNNKTLCRNHAIVVLLLQSGIRNSELRALKVCDLNFEENVVNIRHGKGDKSRQAPFPALAQNAVKEYLNSKYRPEYLTDEDWLFGCVADEFGHSTSEAIWRPLSVPTLERMINRYIEKITGHKKVKVHALRHAYASLCDELDIPISIVSKTLGHSNINITASVYTHVLNKSKAAKEINKVFDDRFALTD